MEFACHDITNRAERLSAFDLTVMGMCGDVKYSTYFLTVEDARTAEVDFFITRLYNEVNGRWMRVVFLTPAAWVAIDGETIPVTLEDAVSLLPAAVSVTVGAATFVLNLYEDWKMRVLSHQTAKGSEPNGRQDDIKHE